MRSEWVRQLADMLSSAAQDPSTNYATGLEQLNQLADKLAAKDPNDPLISYVRFRRMYSDYALSQQVPNADFAKIQEKWLTDLEAFATEFSASPDAAEAMLQLGMSYEFAGQTDKAKEWYQQAGQGFPATLRKPRRPAACCDACPRSASRCDSRPRTSRAGR